MSSPQRSNRLYRVQSRHFFADNLANTSLAEFSNSMGHLCKTYGVRLTGQHSAKR